MAASAAMTEVVTVLPALVAGSHRGEKLDYPGKKCRDQIVNDVKLDYSELALNVSHCWIWPVSMPRLNQRTRCSADPCVKLSGTT